MEVQNLQPAAEGAADGIARAAGRTVVPRHQDPGVIDQKIVADGVTPPVIDRREHLDGIGGGQHPPEAFAVGLREAGLLSPEGTSRTSGLRPRSSSTASAAARSNPTAIPLRKVRKPRAYNSSRVRRKAPAASPQ